MHIFTPSISSSSRNVTLMTPSSAPKSAKRKRADYENELIETATSSLKEIKSALSKENPPATSTGSKKGRQSEMLGQFVAKQMSFIEESNQELFLDVQHQISEIIYKARKSCLT